MMKSSSTPSVLGRFAQIGNIGLIASVIMLAVAMSIAYPTFLTAVNVEVIGMGFIQEAIMALGMTLVIISGGIDLSVAAVLPFTAIIVGLLLRAQVGVAPAIVITLLAAAVIGFLNALMVNRLKVHPMIATLATATMIRGISLVITEGQTVAGFPENFYFLAQGRVLGMPLPIMMFFFLAIVFWYLLKNHTYFQQIFFIGGNPRAARLSGINVERTLVFVYVTSAVLAGLAGIITASQYISANTGFGLNSELRVITAVVIGGASLSGGKGSIGGTIWGVLFLAIINNAFVQSGAPTYWQDIVNGGMLLVAVCLDQVLKIRRRHGAKPQVILGRGEMGAAK